MQRRQRKCDGEMSVEGREKKGVESRGGGEETQTRCFGLQS